MEFLTPEDALAALSFDGSDFSGSILKIRRPKDFVEVAVRMIILTFYFSSHLFFSYLIVALYRFLLVVGCLIFSF